MKNMNQLKESLSPATVATTPAKGTYAATISTNSADVFPSTGQFGQHQEPQAAGPDVLLLDPVVSRRDVISRTIVKAKDDSERFAAFRCVETLGNKESPIALPAHNGPIKVVVVDEDDDTRAVLYRILEQSGKFRCVGSYASGEEAIRRAPGVRPQIVLTEIRLPGISGIECMRRLTSLLPGLTVVWVSGIDDLETMARALAVGGDGYLSKPFAISQCLATLTLSIRHSLSGTQDASEIDAPCRKGGCECARLTSRENQIMSGLVKGLLYKEIADKQRVSISVVRKLAHNIYTKLRVSNRTEAIGRLQDQRQSRQKDSTPLFCPFWIFWQAANVPIVLFLG